MGGQPLQVRKYQRRLVAPKGPQGPSLAGSATVTHRVLSPRIAGSNPAIPTIYMKLTRILEFKPLESEIPAGSDLFVFDAEPMSRILSVKHRVLFNVEIVVCIRPYAKLGPFLRLIVDGSKFPVFRFIKSSESKRGKNKEGVYLITFDPEILGKPEAGKLLLALMDHSLWFIRVL